METVNPHSTASTVPLVESENDPLQNSYNSDVLKTSGDVCRGTGASKLSVNHLQSLQPFVYNISPLVIEADNYSTPLSIIQPLALYSGSPLCRSPAFSSNSPNILDESLADNPTPDCFTDKSLQPVNEKEYNCAYESCKELCLGFRAYESHCASAHSRFPCQLCTQTYRAKSNCTRHMRNHDKAKIHPCPDCNKCFSRLDAMKEHRLHHTVSYQQNKCLRCKQEFKRKSLLLTHLKTCLKSLRIRDGGINESLFLPMVPGSDDYTSSSVKIEDNNDSLSTVDALIKKNVGLAVPPITSQVHQDHGVLDLCKKSTKE